MNYRTFGQSKTPVSEMGIGTWQLGGAEWGDVSESDAVETLAAAVEAGVTFIDTADIYGMGRSERLIQKFLSGRSDNASLFIATKLGRHPEPGWPDNFELDAVRRHTEASLERLGVDALDLTQTHCVPADQMNNDGIFKHLRQLQDEGLIKRFGASVETVAEANACFEVDGLESLQVIFNIFRQKLIGELFERAAERGVAIIVRLPLASGLLAGKYTAETTFSEKDHRNFNRDGDAFNVGETFAGLPFKRGLQLVDQIRALVPAEMSMAQFAMRWCLDFDAVTTVIPGARNPDQARANAAVSDLTPLDSRTHQQLREMYDTDIAQHIRGGY